MAYGIAETLFPANKISMLQNYLFCNKNLSGQMRRRAAGTDL
jgi:hypothetical protein